MKHFVFFLFVLASMVSYSQKTYTFEEVDSLMLIEKKPVFIFLHTDWCGYCKMMQKTTLNTAEIKHILDNDFYTVYFNPEENKDITFSGQTFKYIPRGKNSGMNELANELALIDGKISYPTSCFLNSDYEIIFQLNSYMSYEEFLVILKKIKQHVR